MAFLNYGTTQGLAYRHDFKQWNDENARQEQLNMAKKAADQQKASWIADKLKLGKTWTEFDSKGMQTMAQDIYKQAAAILNQDGSDTDPGAIAQINFLSTQLLDNQYTRRSTRVEKSYEMLLKDMNNPEIAENEEAKAELMTSLQRYQNYDKFGNNAGLEGGDIEEYYHNTPKLFDVNAEFDKMAPNIGTQGTPWDTGPGGASGVKTTVKNMPEVIETIRSGPQGKSYERAYEKYKAKGGTFKSFNDWVQYNVEKRIDTGSTYHRNPEASGGGGGDGSDSVPLLAYETYVQPKLAQITAQSKANPGKVFQTYVSNAYLFAAGAGEVDGQGRGIMTMPTNQDFLISDPGLPPVTLTEFSGKTMTGIYGNTISSVNGQSYIDFTTRIFAGKNNGEFTDKILKNSAWFDVTTGPEDYSTKYGKSVVPATDSNGKAIEGAFDVTGKVPIQIDDEKKARYDATHQSQKDVKSASVTRIGHQATTNSLGRQAGLTKAGQSTIIEYQGQPLILTMGRDGNVTAKIK